MPGPFSFTKYFKKTPQSSSASQSSDQGSVDNRVRASYSQSTDNGSTQTTTTVTSSSSAAPYSGIGNPPGGVSYSGIGNPPGGGQPYSGIGNPSTPLGASPPPPPQSAQISSTTAQGTISAQAGTDQSTGPGSAQAGTDQSTGPGSAQAGTDQSTGPGAHGVTLKASAIDMKKRVGMDILSRLTARTNQALLSAVGKAKDLKQEYVDTEHVLWGLIADSSIYQLLSECKAVPSEIQAELEKGFKKGNFVGQPHFSPRVKRVLELALSAARSLGYEFISPEHILLALSHEGEGMAARTLAKFGVTQEVLNKKIAGKKELNKEGEEKGHTSTIEQFSDDLTAKAARGELDPVVGRSWEIERVIHILSRRTKNNPCLIGEAGVGKTAIVEGLAQRIAKHEVPESLLHKRILSLDLMSLIAGARHRGEFEERLKNLLKEVKAAGGAIILFIDEIHNMVGAGSGSEGTMDASNILKPSLARGELQTIGTTTITEYRKYIEKDPALERRFQPILVSEPSLDTAIEMLLAIRDKYEAFHRVKVSDEAVDAAVKLSSRYIGDRFLPDKAVDLIDEAAASVRLPAISLPEEIRSGEVRLKKLESEKKEAEKIGDNVHGANVTREIEELMHSLSGLKEQYQVKKSTTTNAVTPDIIADIVSRWTKIPVARLTESESTKLMDMETIIHKRLIDQEEAVSAVSEAVRRGRAGLKSTKRPIGSFIFMGPTGVGKTELAKALAEILFGSEEMMVRLDMTEYMEKHEVAKLIGAPPGYVGYEEGGQLTEAVRRRPYSVVLLDEIEKAHPDVFNILIQLLDDGRLTDNKGHTISFKNTIVICTSNLGSGMIQEEMLGWGEEPEEQKAKSKERKTLSTYAVSPTGREIVTIGKIYYEKDQQARRWKKATLKDYFAGGAVSQIGDKEFSSFGTTPEMKEFPIEGFDTHLIAPDGSETITLGEIVWWRPSTVAKQWTVKPLTSYFSGHMVVNALPDRPDQQLPTAKMDTHAISSTGAEMVTLGEKFWQRDNGQVKDWTTGLLSDYVEKAQVESSQKDAQTPVKQPASQSGAQLIQTRTSKPAALPLPQTQWDAHVFTPNDEEVTIANGTFWKRTKSNDNKWVSGELAELFPTLDALETSAEASDIGTLTELSIESEEEKRLDTYVISPQGKEIITIGEAYFEKDAKSEAWKKSGLNEYFAQPGGSKSPEFQGDHVDTHCIAPDGSETITVDDQLWYRPQDFSAWSVKPLNQFFLNHTVVNAKAGSPDQKLPTSHIDTHSISPTGAQVITSGERFFRRENQTDLGWTTGITRDYFTGANLVPAGSSQENTNLIQSRQKDKTPPTFPKENWDTHLFTSKGEEIVIAEGKFFRKKQPGDTQWETGNQHSLFSTLKIEGEKEQTLPFGKTQKEEKKNVGARDERFAALAKRLMDELRKFFRPELLNRYDEVVVFRPLGREHMEAIVDLQTTMLSKLVSEQNIALSFSKEARIHLAKVGYDRIFGARPLRRTIQRLVENPISTMLIKGEVTAGDSIEVGFDGFSLTFSVKKMERKSVVSDLPAGKAGQSSEISEEQVKEQTQTQKGQQQTPPTPGNQPSAQQVPQQPQVPPSGVQSQQPQVPPAPVMTPAQAVMPPSSPSAPVIQPEGGQAPLSQPTTHNPQPTTTAPPPLNPLESYFATDNGQNPSPTSPQPMTNDKSTNDQSSSTLSQGA